MQELTTRKKKLNLNLTATSFMSNTLNGTRDNEDDVAEAMVRIQDKIHNSKRILS